MPFQLSHAVMPGKVLHCKGNNEITKYLSLRAFTHKQFNSEVMD